jgi:hypothetical protein
MATAVYTFQELPALAAFIPPQPVHIKRPIQLKLSL